MQQSPEYVLFTDIFIQYKKRFIRFAYAYTRDEFEAENIVMDALLYYWEHRFQIEKNSNIPAYIFTIIKHSCLNYLKRIQMQESVHERMREHVLWEINMRITSLEKYVPEEIFSKETSKLVNNAIQKLPEKTRRIFILNRMKEKSYSEIALQEEMSVKNVEYHISKALKKLRVELKDYVGLFLIL